LTKDQTSEILSDTVKEFNETYSRYLKTVVSVNDNVPIDTTCGLPLEIVLLSCKTALGQEAAIKFRLLHNGEPSIDSPIRVLSNGTATIVRTDSTGAAQAMVAKDKPLLLAHTQITKLSENRLQSVWTNLAVYWIKK